MLLLDRFPLLERRTVWRPATAVQADGERRRTHRERHDIRLLEVHLARNTETAGARRRRDRLADRGAYPTIASAIEVDSIAVTGT